MRTLTSAAAIPMLMSLVLASTASGAPDNGGASSGLTDPVILALIGDDDLFATADLTVLLDPPGPNGTQHYGPYPSGSPDSGTCGNDWAEDSFDRHFTVRPNPDGSFTVVQQFRDGTFETVAGVSPGSCEGGSSPGTVEAGVTGKMHGYFIIPVSSGQTSTDPHCNATTMSDVNCTTATFINTHFSPACYPALCGVTTFAFHFSAGDQGLVEHEWKNASSDRGGNHGDIRSTNVP